MASWLTPSRIFVLDGPTGTRLVEKGYQAHEHTWVGGAAIESPSLLFEVHMEYLQAGADILTANTFRTSGYGAEKSGLTRSDARKMTHASIAVATEAVEAFDSDKSIYIAGSLAPLEDCYVPEETPEVAVLEEHHMESAAWLAETGCDMILIETMPTSREALTATRAASRAGFETIATSFITDPSGTRLLGGDSLLDSAQKCAAAGANAILVNCVSLTTVPLALKELRSLREKGVVLGAYANGAKMVVQPGMPLQWENDSRSLQERTESYAKAAEQWVKEGAASLVGACCGTGPDYIAAVSKVVAQARKWS